MKLGDKNYWKTGDDVYCMDTRTHTKISDYREERWGLIGTEHLCSYKWDTGNLSDSDHTEQSLFHTGALTFDKAGRVIAINYDFEV